MDKVAWHKNNYKIDGAWGVRKTTHRVGDKLPNELGLYDMSGNVWEWCEDKWKDDYGDTSKDNSDWIEGSGLSRVLRGGSWFNYSYFCSVSRRDGSDPWERVSSFGFRLAQD